MAHHFLSSFHPKDIIGQHHDYLKKICKEDYKQFSQDLERHCFKYKLFGFLDVISCSWTERSFKVVLFKYIPLIEYRKK